MLGISSHLNRSGEQAVAPTSLLKLHDESKKNQMPGYGESVLLDISPEAQKFLADQSKAAALALKQAREENLVKETVAKPAEQNTEVQRFLKRLDQFVTNLNSKKPAAPEVIKSA